MILRNGDKPRVLPLVIVAAAIVAAFIITCGLVLYFAHDGGETGVGGAAGGSLPAAAERPDADGRYVFLVAGRDEVSGLTDVLLLVDFDTSAGRVSLLQLPRDTYFNCTSGSYKKLNGASAALGGLRSLADRLGAALGIEIDYTAELTLEAFSHLIDLIGGVPITLPYDMDYEDPSQGLYIHLEAGEHTLCGAEAVQFIRFRSGYVQGDIGRIDAQKLFLAALARQVTEGLSPLRLPAMIGAVLGEVKTDMSAGTALSLARAAMHVELADIAMLTLPGRDARTGVDSGAWYYIMNRAAAAEVMERYFGADAAALDPERCFTGAAYPHFDKIYDADDITYREYRADDINRNGIGIDLTG